MMNISFYCEQMGNCIDCGVLILCHNYCDKKNNINGKKLEATDDSNSFVAKWRAWHTEPQLDAASLRSWKAKQPFNGNDHWMVGGGKRQSEQEVGGGLRRLSQ